MAGLFYLVMGLHPRRLSVPGCPCAQRTLGRRGYCVPPRYQPNLRSPAPFAHPQYPDAKSHQVPRDLVPLSPALPLGISNLNLGA